MNGPLVSIQIPTYNQRTYIKEAVESALQQTYQNLEIIVSDDCSPEYDIFEILCDYLDNPKICIYRNEENVGRVANYRKTLYDRVKGEWFVNLDGDDYFINNDFIERAINVIQQTKNTISAFQADCDLTKLKKADFGAHFLDTSIAEVDGHTYLANITKGLGFSHASVIFNTELAKQSDFYHVDTLDADYFSFLKILMLGNILFWNEKVYVWRSHSNNATWTFTKDHYQRKLVAVKDLERHAKKHLSIGQITLLVNNVRYNCYWQMIEHFYFNRDYKYQLHFIRTQSRLTVRYLHLNLKYFYRLFNRIDNED